MKKKTKKEPFSQQLMNPNSDFRKEMMNVWSEHIKSKEKKKNYDN